MIKDYIYKQQIWSEYNRLINRYAHQNDSNSVNVRLIHMNPDTSNLDAIGGSLENWSSKLTQLNWIVYENVPLFTNAPAVTQSGQINSESLQSFTATLKFIIEPLPYDMIMFYDDPSQTIYNINVIRYHKTIQTSLKIFEMDLQTTPIDSDTFYTNLAIESHQYFNLFNCQLFDYIYFRENLKPIVDKIEQIVRDVNGYFLGQYEVYYIKEFNDLVREILKSSRWGAILRFHVPLGNTNIPEVISLADPHVSQETHMLYDELKKVREIFVNQEGGDLCS